MSTTLHVVSLVAVVTAAAVLILVARNLSLGRRFSDVTAAQQRRGAAYRALEAAYRRAGDPAREHAEVAAAEEAVRAAEAGLPRNRRSRAYFARRKQA